MPIYEYLCDSCGVKKEHFQKMSDAPINNCPACGSENYNKLISAAGFQLKGSGWYVTDFRNKPTQPAAQANQDTTKTTATDTKNNSSTETKIDSTTTKTAAKPAETKTASAD